MTYRPRTFGWLVSVHLEGNYVLLLPTAYHGTIGGNIFNLLCLFITQGGYLLRSVGGTYSQVWTMGEGGGGYLLSGLDGGEGGGVYLLSGMDGGGGGFTYSQVSMGGFVYPSIGTPLPPTRTA